MTDFQGILVIVLLHCVFSIAATDDEFASDKATDERTAVVS